MTNEIEYSPLNEMRLISQGKLFDNRLKSLEGKNVENQAKLFLAAQARHELERIIKLTEFLDNIEQKFLTAINTKIIEQPDNINLLMTSMDIITQSLKRSNELVNNVLNNNGLQALVVNTVNLIPGAEDTSIISRKSRDAIRAVATNLIEQLQQEEVVTNFTDSEDNKEEAIIDEKEIIDNKINELLSE